MGKSYEQVENKQSNART